MIIRNDADRHKFFAFLVGRGALLQWRDSLRRSQIISFIYPTLLFQITKEV